MARKPVKEVRNMGRFKAAPYIKHIRERFEDKFPDNVHRDWVIDHVLKFFWEYVKEHITNEEEVRLYGIGKFWLAKRKSNVEGIPQQYHPKLKFSPHFIANIREKKGTLTKTDRKSIESKRDFMSKVWEGRKQYMLEKRGYLPKSIANYGKDVGIGEIGSNELDS